jgi:NAD(P)-dependent dehydrogenase (short-subunit alcohol dehydrogenase family)
VSFKKNFVDTSSEEWDRIIVNNLKSCFFCCREVAKHMIGRGGGGKIINISSIHAHVSEPGFSLYVTAKGGMEAFTKTIACELAPYGITVNCLAPGATYTEMNEKAFANRRVVESLQERIPLGKIATARQIARVVVFLASEDADYLTGTTVVADGGYMIDGSLPFFSL